MPSLVGLTGSAVQPSRNFEPIEDTDVKPKALKEDSEVHSPRKQFPIAVTAVSPEVSNEVSETPPRKLAPINVTDVSPEASKEHRELHPHMKLS